MFDPADGDPTDGTRRIAEAHPWRRRHGGPVMRMEFRRLTGKVLWTRDWSAYGASTADLREQARETLKSFYEGDQLELWPKAEFRDKAPEEVTIFDASGKLLAAYDILNLMADTKHRISDMKNR